MGNSGRSGAFKPGRVLRQKAAAGGQPGDC